MATTKPNLLVILGPTASGKTRLGVELARRLGGEIVSVDSRQVYRGLDIGTGKDLAEYTEGGAPVPYHLIDVVDVDEEYSVFDFQQDFYRIFEKLRSQQALPIAVGGTGLYLEAVLQRYRMVKVPTNPVLRAELELLPDEELAQQLLALKPDLHNTSDLGDRSRAVRAIEIALYSRDHEPEPAPPIDPLVLGIRWPRQTLHQRIRDRLRARLDEGLIEEVQGLRAAGASWQRLHALGLEYRFVADYLTGKIRKRGFLLRSLSSAIIAFAKRQETWFRRMERRGTVIHWLNGNDAATAMQIIDAHGGLAPETQRRSE